MRFGDGRKTGVEPPTHETHVVVDRVDEGSFVDDVVGGVGGEEGEGRAVRKSEKGSVEGERGVEGGVFEPEETEEEGGCAASETDHGGSLRGTTDGREVGKEEERGAEFGVLDAGRIVCGSAATNERGVVDGGDVRRNEVVEDFEHGESLTGDGLRGPGRERVRMRDHEHDGAPPRAWGCLDRGYADVVGEGLVKGTDGAGPVLLEDGEVHAVVSSVVPSRSGAAVMGGGVVGAFGAGSENL